MTKQFKPPNMYYKAAYLEWVDVLEKAGGGRRQQEGMMR